LRYC